MILTSIRKPCSKTTTFAITRKGISGLYKLESEGFKKVRLIMSLIHRMKMTSSLKSTTCFMDPD